MLVLTRQQIAQIVGNDPVAIQAFEVILSGVSITLPSDIEGVEVSVAVGEARVASLIDAIQQLAQAVAALPCLSEMDAAPDELTVAPDRIGQNPAVADWQPQPAAAPREITEADLAPPLVGGASGAFTTSDPFTVTVVDGRIVSIA